MQQPPRLREAGEAVVRRVLELQRRQPRVDADAEGAACSDGLGKRVGGRAGDARDAGDRGDGARERAGVEVDVGDARRRLKKLQKK